MKHKISVSLILTLMLSLLPGKLMATVTASSLSLTPSKQPLDANHPPIKLAENAKITCDQKDGCSSDDPRGPIADPHTPYIISPSDTYLLNDRPSLSWNSVPDAISYTVRVKDITGERGGWERTVPKLSKSDLGEMMNYPTDEEALQPGGKYKVIVEAKFSSREKRVESGEARFTMLSSEEIQQVEAKVKDIVQLKLSPTEKALKIYEIYMAKELVTEAREVLEELVKGGSQIAKVYRLLGDSYSQQGLIDLAKPRYEKAVALAATTGDSKELEDAQKGLDRTNAYLKKRASGAP